MSKETINIDEDYKEDFSILKLLKSRVTVEGIKQYLVLWEDNSESWVLETDISSYSIQNDNTIKSTNNNIVKLAQNTNTSISSKKAFIYTRTSPTNKKSIQQTMSSLQLGKNSHYSSGAGTGGGGPAPSSDTVCDSIATQQHFCLKYCMDNHIKVEFIASDVNVSARFMNNLKKELGFFTKHLTPNYSSIIIYDPDRLSRHSAKGQSFLEEMAALNIDVHFVKQGYVYNKATPSHIKHQIHTLLNNAEFYSNQTSERVKNTFKRKKMEGHQYGRPKFGYKFKKVNGINKTIPHRNQQKTITLIKKLYRDLNRSNDKNMTQVARLIIDELTSRKITNVRHKSFSTNMIIGILKGDTSFMNCKNSDMYMNLLGANLKNMTLKSTINKGNLPSPPSVIF